MSRNRWFYCFLGLAAAAPPVLVGACGSDTQPVECGSGMKLVDGECVAIEADGGPDAMMPDAEPEGGMEAGPEAGPDAAPQDPDFHFGGVTSVSPASTSSLLITWDPATDPFTLPEEMLYEIFLAPKAGEEKFDQAPAAFILGASSIVVSGLAAGMSYFVVVRATNDASVQDTNVKELSAKTQQDIMDPTFTGTPTVVPRLGCRSRVSWSPAVDDLTAAPGIKYHVFLADTLPVDTSQPPLVSVIGATTVDVPPAAVTPYHSYLVIAEDAAGNKSNNTQEGTAVPDTLKFDESIQPILTNNCAPSCHTVNTTNKFTPAFDDGYAYEGLLGLPGAPAYSQFCKVAAGGFCALSNAVAGCADWSPDAGPGDGGAIQYRFVTPSSPECSIFYQVLNQNKMPPQGISPPSACDTTLIHDWIQHGAQP